MPATNNRKDIPREEIRRILFHRYEKLLIDTAFITEEEIIGELTISSASCAGHEPVLNIPVFPGAYWADAAAQLLGIVIGASDKYSYLHDLAFYAIGYDGIEFHLASFPEECIFLKIAPSEIKVVEEKKDKKYTIEGRDFFICGKNGTKKATIKSAKIGAISKELLKFFLESQRKQIVA